MFPVLRKSCEPLTTGSVLTRAQDVASKRSIGIHCATFCLTDEAMDEPAKLLVQEAAAAKLAPEEFVQLQHGAILRTAGGKDLNSPPLLPPASA